MGTDTKPRSMEKAGSLFVQKSGLSGYWLATLPPRKCNNKFISLKLR